MEYREAVAEAQRLDHVIEEAESAAEEAKWARADLALEQVKTGISRRQWARDTGKHHSTIDRWVLLAERYPSGGLGRRPPFEPAYAELRGYDPEQSKYAQNAQQAVRNMPPEQRAEVVREALQDEEVAERVVRDRPTRVELAKAETKVEREREHVARERYELAEPRSVQIGAMADGQYALTKARQAFEDAAEAADTLAAHNWPDNSKEQMAALTQRAIAAGELVRAKVEGRDLDAELQALLEGGE